jgi:hypothetical protein
LLKILITEQIFLADANKPALGYGFDFGFMSYSKFNAYFGYEHSYYRTTNIEKAGNINSTRLNLSFKATKHLYANIFGTTLYWCGCPTLHFKFTKVLANKTELILQ